MGDHFSTENHHSCYCVGILVSPAYMPSRGLSVLGTFSHLILTSSQ